MDLRWRLAEDEAGGERSPQPALFPEDELVERHVGKGEFRGMEFLHVNARRVINEVPAASHMPFRFTINAYRGCSHACSYCVLGTTPVLMADGRTKAIADVRVGDRLYGTVRRGNYRRFVVTEVLAHWSTVKSAYRVTLDDGTQLVASGDHRFLTDRGWKHVIGAGRGSDCRPHLTTNNHLMGTGEFATKPDDSPDYRAGYLCGMIRGDGTIGHYITRRAGLIVGRSSAFRLALIDFEALLRTSFFLDELAIPTTSFLFQAATDSRKAVYAIRAQSGAKVAAIEATIDWPTSATSDWRKGFLAGIFDAEGSYSRGILRFSNKDEKILGVISECLDALDFPHVRELPRPDGCSNIRITEGVQQHLRFFHTVDPAITRKLSIEGQAIKNKARLRVKSIEPLGVELPMYDITTGTGDFIANGVVSHNCFARPTHDYLGLNIGEDFERRIVVKVNAVERVRAELRSSKWRRDPIAMGTNTDPYQRAEGKYHLTRGIIEVLSEAANPFSILTKSTLILRDLDLLKEAAHRTSVRTSFSIGTLDERVWKASEPGTPHPRKRVEAVARLVDAGIPCGVLIAPVLPGLSDRPEQVEEVARACLEAGASSISALVLHLRKGVKEHFMTWLKQAFPDLVPEYERLYGGRAYLPKADQARVTAVVTRVLDEMRPRQRVHVYARGHTGHERGGTSARDGNLQLSSQLGLFD